MISSQRDKDADHEEDDGRAAGRRGVMMMKRWMIEIPYYNYKY
jgi:hypothetical protein